MANRLFVIPGSHPAVAARMMLEMKGIGYKRTDLIPVVSKGVLRAAGFPGTTVPALKLDSGERVQGSKEIARKLDEVRPDPPLFPADPKERTEVERAETWGDVDLQGIARRVLWNAMRRDRSAMGSYAEGARLGVPIGLAVKTGGPIIYASAKFNRADDETVRGDIASIPGALNRIEAWLTEGILGGETPNAADLQVATSLRLLMTLEDIRPAIEGRPAGEYAKRVVPDYPGKIPPVFPTSWLDPLRTESPAAA